MVLDRKESNRLKLLGRQDVKAVAKRARLFLVYLIRWLATMQNKCHATQYAEHAEKLFSVLPPKAYAFVDTQKRGDA